MSDTVTPETKDVSMVDVSNAQSSESSQDGDQKNGIVDPPLRRKSTLILTDDNYDQMQVDKKEGQDNDNKSHTEEQQTNPSEAGMQQQYNQQEYELPDPNLTIPVDIKWVQGGEKVYVTGSFTGWRKMIGLVKQPDNTFSITLGLPVGTHRFRFVIDNELRFSDFLPSATDQMGNFVNYIEVTVEHIRTYLEQQEQKQQDASKTSRKSSISRSSKRVDSMWGLINDDDDMGNGYSRYHDDEAMDNSDGVKYITDIPPIFTDPKVMEQYYIAIDKQAKNQNQLQSWLHPPQLPPHLEHVILNNFNSMDKDNNSGALPIPNHVVLNHLATTSIKHNTLAVASVVRYKRKYVTQVLYAPLQQ